MFKQVNNPKHETKTNIPVRATKTSAGYDLEIKEDVELLPGEVKVLATDLCCEIRDNEVAKMYVRSSIGIKRGLRLANGTGIIDADYYQNGSGNIHIPLHNYQSMFNIVDIEVFGFKFKLPIPAIERNTVKLKAGERVGQIVIVEYKTTKGEIDPNRNRNGGFGSTGR